MKKLKEKIEQVLRKYPATRNSDVELTIKVWEEYYNVVYSGEFGKAILVKDLFNVPRQSDIKRIRAQIQNEERRYLPTDIRILIERIKLSKTWREFLGYKVNRDVREMTDAEIEKAIDKCMSKGTQQKLEYM